MLNGKKVLVTGAGGFIASHLVERLVAEGAKVRAFVRYNSRGDAGLLRRLQVSTVRPVIYGDVNWYSGSVARVIESGEEALISIRLEGVNQLCEVTTTGLAEVSLPLQMGIRPARRQVNSIADAPRVPVSSSV